MPDDSAWQDTPHDRIRHIASVELAASAIRNTMGEVLMSLDYLKGYEEHPLRDPEGKQRKVLYTLTTKLLEHAVQQLRVADHTALFLTKQTLDPDGYDGRSLGAVRAVANERMASLHVVINRIREKVRPT